MIEINSKGRRQKKSDADCAVFDLVARIAIRRVGWGSARLPLFCVLCMGGPAIYFFLLEAFDAFDVAFEAFDAPDTTEKI